MYISEDAFKTELEKKYPLLTTLAKFNKGPLAVEANKAMRELKNAAWTVEKYNQHGG